MKIALHDSDRTDYPNLALMKLSAWHKKQEDEVAWFTALERETFDWVYSSKVFTFTAEDPYLLATTERGGYGYGLKRELPDFVEHICPDYSLYGLTYSLGFLTRGCSRKCAHCFVPDKEGEIRQHADVEEFARHKAVTLMDNNVLAHPWGIEQIEKMGRLGLRVDFNQGLDARLIDDGIARRLSRLKWQRFVRLACDHKNQMADVERAVRLLRWHNAKAQFFCYVLVRDVEDALERVRHLKGLYVDPFAQPFRDAKGTDPTDEQRAFARWVNHKAEFKSRTWEEYRGAA